MYLEKTPIKEFLSESEMKGVFNSNQSCANLNIDRCISFLKNNGYTVTRSKNSNKKKRIKNKHR